MALTFGRHPQFYGKAAHTQSIQNQDHVESNVIYQKNKNKKFNNLINILSLVSFVCTQTFLNK
jgi:TRAP-type mannitol/chloroaromatic compound transport system permease small subunit